MKRKKWPFVLVGMLFLIGVAGSILVLQRPDTNWVEIVQNDEILYRIDLTQAEDQVLEVEYEGRINTVEIKNHQIHMLTADCPDHTCINMGWLDSAGPIVCLPNRLVIRFADSLDDLDA